MMSLKKEGGNVPPVALLKISVFDANLLGTRKKGLNCLYCYVSYNGETRPKNELIPIPLVPSFFGSYANFVLYEEPVGDVYVYLINTPNTLAEYTQPHEYHQVIGKVRIPLTGTNFVHGSLAFGSCRYYRWRGVENKTHLTESESNKKESSTLADIEEEAEKSTTHRKEKGKSNKRHSGSPSIAISSSSRSHRSDSPSMVSSPSSPTHTYIQGVPLHKFRGELRVGVKLVKCRRSYVSTGRWEGTSSGGDLEHAGWENSPQYMLTVGARCITTLLLDSDLLRRRRRPICLYVLRLARGERSALRKPLGEDDLRSTVEAHHCWHAQQANRPLCAEVDLLNGTYILLPCVGHPGDVGDYRLTVLVDQDVPVGLEQLHRQAEDEAGKTQLIRSRQVEPEEVHSSASEAAAAAWKEASEGGSKSACRDSSDSAARPILLSPTTHSLFPWPDAKMQSQFSPLCQAAVTGQADKLKAALAEALETGLREGKKISEILDAAATATCGRSALSLCASGGFVDCVELLLEAGANPAHLDRHGNNCVSYAAYGGSAACVQAMLEHTKRRIQASYALLETTPSASSPSKSRRKSGGTRGRASGLALLQGATAARQAEGGTGKKGARDGSALAMKTAIHKLCGCACTESGMTPLLLAVSLGHREVCATLMQSGGGVTAKACDVHHETALYKTTLRGDLPFSRLLVESRLARRTRNLFAPPVRATGLWECLALRLQLGGNYSITRDDSKKLRVLEVYSGLGSIALALLQVCVLNTQILSVSLIVGADLDLSHSRATADIDRSMLPRKTQSHAPRESRASPGDEHDQEKEAKEDQEDSSFVLEDEGMDTERLIVEAVAEGTLEVLRVLAERGELPEYSNLCKLIGVSPMVYDQMPMHEFIATFLGKEWHNDGSSCTQSQKRKSDSSRRSTQDEDSEISSPGTPRKPKEMANGVVDMIPPSEEELNMHQEPYSSPNLTPARKKSSDGDRHGQEVAAECKPDIVRIALLNDASGFCHVLAGVASVQVTRVLGHQETPCVIQCPAAILSSVTMGVRAIRAELGAVRMSPAMALFSKKLGKKSKHHKKHRSSKRKSSKHRSKYATAKLVKDKSDRKRDTIT